MLPDITIFISSNRKSKDGNDICQIKVGSLAIVHTSWLHAYLVMLHLLVRIYSCQCIMLERQQHLFFSLTKVWFKSLCIKLKHRNNCFSTIDRILVVQVSFWNSDSVALSWSFVIKFVFSFKFQEKKSSFSPKGKMTVNLGYERLTTVDYKCKENTVLLYWM